MDGHQRQKEQSGRMIEEALFKLMEKKPYTQITVSAITAKADISRRTFYRLYREKDEVLSRYMEKLCRRYKDEAPALERYDISRISREYFTFWYQYRDFLLLMHKQGLDELVCGEINRAALSVIQSRIKAMEYKDSGETEYFADYSTGGFTLLLQRWIMHGMELGPEEYAEAVSSSVQRFLNSLQAME